MPQGHILQFADYVTALHVVCAVVNSSRGDAHLLLFDEALSKPPLMDAIAMPVCALVEGGGGGGRCRVQTGQIVGVFCY